MEERLQCWCTLIATALVHCSTPTVETGKACVLYPLGVAASFVLHNLAFNQLLLFYFRLWYWEAVLVGLAVHLQSCSCYCTVLAARASANTEVLNLDTKAVLALSSTQNASERKQAQHPVMRKLDTCRGEWKKAVHGTKPWHSAWRSCLSSVFTAHACGTWLAEL